MQDTGTPDSGPGLAGRGVHQVRLFFIALQFFTRLPIPRWVGFDPCWLHQASRYFPAAGVVVGVIAAVAYALAGHLWPPPIAALLSTVAGIYLTGAFHEDGFADTCDGFGGGTTPQRVLEIMQDSRIGAYGAIGIGLLLAIKCMTLTCLPSGMAIAGLLAAHPLSRLAATTLICTMHYVKQEGKAKPLAQRMSIAEWCIAAVTVAPLLCALIIAGWLPWQGLAAGTAAVLVAAGWLAHAFRRRLGGYTGDCLGAVQQMSEAAFYLALLAVVR